ncbi:Bug family tripartite tricarboxylate transporter substrate binding protein [Gaopeijia maritima]|uniref:Tripartite tricarboxylate transporter substrate-binding protein n=1 Tax=Gaopeijia maritima TaxID=3119007 RepID=A0ABU9ECR8_9BACT
MHLPRAREPALPSHPPSPVHRVARGLLPRLGAGEPARGRRPALWATAAVVLAAGCAPAGPRGWECFAPANAGGGWDLTCRTAARALEDLGLSPGPVRTTNLPGAGGGVAMARAITRRADDPGLIVAASTGTTLRLAQEQYGRMRTDDVRWIGALAAEYGIVAVAADAPWRDLRSLLGDWAADPDGIVASGGSAVAGQDHMKLLLLARAAGMDPLRIRYIPFDGGGEAQTALLGGFVQVFSGEASEVEGQVAAGNLRILAVLAPRRLDGALASVPTAREQGYAVDWITWRGFFIPREVADSVADRWVSVLDSVGRSDRWVEERARYRLRPFHLVGAEFESFVQAQVAEFRALSQDLGLLPPDER